MRQYKKEIRVFYGFERVGSVLHIHNRRRRQDGRRVESYREALRFISV